MTLNIRLKVLTFVLFLATPIQAFAVYPKISIGEDYMLLLKSDGTVWAWGANGSGQLGTGNTNSALTPVEVSGLTGVIDISAGKSGSFSMALKADGTVWVWGNVGSGRSGDLTTAVTYPNKPIQVSSLHQIYSIEAGWYGKTAFATDNLGQVWAWGDGTSGQLGDGLSTVKMGVSAPIPNLNDVIQVSSSDSQVIALKTNGSAVGWGWRNDGDNLLTGNTTDSFLKPTPINVPTLVFLQGFYNRTTAGQFMGIDLNGSVQIWGSTRSGLSTCFEQNLSSITQPYKPSGLANIQQIAGGNMSALFLDKNGSVLGCGDNSWGQLGNGATGQAAYGAPVSASGLPSDINYVAAGFNASAAIAATGNVYTWGRADYGLSGTTNNQTAQRNPIPVKLDINAGPKNTAPAVYAATQSGSLGNAAIDAGLAVAPEHIGVKGEIYIAVVLPNAQILFLDSSGNFIPYDQAKPLPYLFNGSLPQKAPITLASNQDLTSIKGTQIIIGYGLGTGAQANQDLLTNKRYSVAVTLQ